MQHSSRVKWSLSLRNPKLSLFHSDNFIIHKHLFVPMISIWLHTYFKSLMLLHVVLRGYISSPYPFAHRVSMIKTVHVFVAVAWPLCVVFIRTIFWIFECLLGLLGYVTIFYLNLIRTSRNPSTSKWVLFLDGLPNRWHQIGHCSWSVLGSRSARDLIPGPVGGSHGRAIGSICRWGVENDVEEKGRIKANVLTDSHLSDSSMLLRGHGCLSSISSRLISSPHGACVRAWCAELDGGDAVVPLTSTASFEPSVQNPSLPSSPSNRVGWGPRAPIVGARLGRPAIRGPAPIRRRTHPTFISFEGPAADVNPTIRSTETSLWEPEDHHWYCGRHEWSDESLDAEVLFSPPPADTVTAAHQRWVSTCQVLHPSFTWIHFFPS